MAEHIDIAVYIALNEEFSFVLNTLPAPVEVREDSDVSVTYYLFDLELPLLTKKSRILLISAGAMGPPRAAALVAHINSRFELDNVVVLGISGSVDKDVLPGDVFIPKIVDNYLSVAAAVPAKDDPLNWSLSLSGGSYRPDSRLLALLWQIFCVHGIPKSLFL
jgi:nucleoside phosphorylase